LEASSRKVVLSNVSPELPDSLLLESLSPLGKVTSRLMSLGASLRNPNYQHIKSFRRSVYIQLCINENTLPSSVPISFENRHYRIFLSFGDMTCFNCKQTGHTKQNCPKSTEPAPPAIVPSSTEKVKEHATVTINDMPSTSLVMEVCENSQSQSQSQSQSPIALLEPLTSLPKDVATTSTISTTATEQIPKLNASIEPVIRPSVLEWPVLSATSKMKRTSSLNSLNDMEIKKKSKDSFSFSQPQTVDSRLMLSPNIELTPSQEEVLSSLDAADSPFSSTDFVNFLNEAQNKQKVTPIAHKYTDDINALIEVLSKFLKATTDEKLCKRLLSTQLKLKRSCF